MMRKKKAKKKNPFHIEHGYGRFELDGGTVFWAKDSTDAELYRAKIQELSSTNDQLLN